MTMEDIRAMPGDWITPATAAAVMHMDAGRLIEYAKTGQLPFACRISGRRVLISRKSFLEAYGYEDSEEPKPDIQTEILKELMAIRGELLKLRADQMERREAKA